MQQPYLPTLLTRKRKLDETSFTNAETNNTNGTPKPGPAFGAGPVLSRPVVTPVGVGLGGDRVPPIALTSTSTCNTSSTSITPPVSARLTPSPRTRIRPSDGDALGDTELGEAPGERRDDGMLEEEEEEEEIVPPLPHPAQHPHYPQPSRHAPMYNHHHHHHHHHHPQLQAMINMHQQQHQHQHQQQSHDLIPCMCGAAFGNQLHDKMHIVDAQLESLHYMAVDHNIQQYLADIFSQFGALSSELKHRLTQLSQLDSFLKQHHGSLQIVNCSYFSVLPSELNVHILSFLTAQELRVVACVNREWNRYALDESLWKSLCDRRWRERRIAPVPYAERKTKQARRSWRDIYSYRMHVDDNWNKGRCSRVITLAGHESQVCCSQYDAEKIVSGSFDATIRVWDIKNLDQTDEVRCVTTLKKTDHNSAHTDRVLCLMFQDDKLVTGGRDESVKIWDLSTGQCISTLTGHTDNVWYLQFDEKKIISGSADKSMRFWDMRTGQCTQTLVGMLTQFVRLSVV
eukprot:TRINITY_DN5753_c4_g1_i3.p1 TRINITY_DN5753_c4_g1~~TRINITY_DN5753_c4_g1_i3.p1  ORF type:complete len:514 (+),score=83.01 TRINITY_DN5753_c4_g1_i3:250-1791(+)